MQRYSDGVGEGRVYVNNMNTPHATTTLPDFVYDDDNNNKNNNSSHGRYAVDRAAWLSDAERRRAVSLQAMTTAASTRHGGGGALSVVVLDGGDGGRSTTMGGSGVSGNDNDDGDESGGASTSDDRMRQRLARVYERVTRQLQRQLNYDEVARVPLHEQYGVRLTDEADDVATTANATATTTAAMTTAATSSSTSSTAATTAAASRLVRYDGDDAVSSSSAATTAEQQQQAQSVVDDEEVRALTQQPCPAPLRLVLQHVQTTLRDKLALAERGSLHDCLRCTFECRALLNRLLKEMPLYTQYHESMSASRARGGGGGVAAPSTVQLQHLYHAFRQQPVLLPRGVYTESTQTGAIGAALDVSHEHVFVTAATGSSGGGGGDATATMQLTSQQEAAASHTTASATTTAGLLPSLVPALSTTTTTAARSSSNSVVAAATADGGGGSSGAASTMTQIRLPPGYGCSVRMRAHASSSSNSNRVDSDGVAGNNSMLPLSSIDQAGSRDEAAATAAGMLPSLSMTTATTNTAQPPPLQLQRMRDAGATVTSTSSTSWTATRRDWQRLAASAQQQQRKATQCVSVGVVTDDNAVSTISRDAYAQLQARVHELEVQVQEARGERATLVQRLRERDDEGASRAAVIQYLRSTLVRECNLLRTQLCVAAQREQQQQLLLQPVHHHHHHAQAQQSFANVPAAALGMSLSRSLAPRSVGAAATASARSGGAAAMATSAAQHTPRVSQSLLVADNNSSSSASNSNNNNNNNADLSTTHSSVQQTQQQQTQQGLVAVTATTTPATTAPHSASSQQQRVATTTTTTAATVSDMLAVQSLLDVVLLAVEQDELPSPPTSPHRRGSATHDDDDTTTTTMTVAAFARVNNNNSNNNNNTKKCGGGGSHHTRDRARCWREARAEFERRKCALKQTVASMHARQAVVVAAKDREIARLRGLMDWRFVQHAMTEHVRALRAECRRLRNHAQEQLHTFRVNMQTSLAGLLHRARLVDRTSNDNVTLQNTQEALRDLIASAHTLLLPMLTREYAHGYHPWPLKVRNSVDPLAPIVQTRYGLAEVVRVREELSRLSELYVALHRYVVQHTVTPEVARPMTGVTLRELCAALLLHPMSAPDVLFAVRRHYEVERDTCKQLSRLNAQILWVAHLQHTFTERAVAALREGGMNPLTTTLPAAGRINALARQRATLTRSRAALQRARNDNAKELYALWKERQIDIYDGRPVVGAQHRMTLFYDAHTAMRRRTSTATAVAAAALVGNGALAATTTTTTTMLATSASS